MKTAHLLVTESGLLWLHSLAPDATLIEGLACGMVDLAAWPDGLGEEPDWFQGEAEELEAWWDLERLIAEEEFWAEMARMTSEYYGSCLTR